GRIMSFLVRHGFAGDIYPINPHRSEVLGRKAYASIGAVPTPPDVAILAVPPNALGPSVRAAADAGVGCGVIITTGFAEAGPEGDRQAAARAQDGTHSGRRRIGALAHGEPGRIVRGVPGRVPGRRRRAAARPGRHGARRAFPGAPSRPAPWRCRDPLVVRR